MSQSADTTSLVPSSECYTSLSFFNEETYKNSLDLSAEFIAASSLLASTEGFNHERTFTLMTENLGAVQPCLVDAINGICLEIVREVAKTISDDDLKDMRRKVRACRDTRWNFSLMGKTCTVLHSLLLYHGNSRKATRKESYWMGIPK